MQIIYHGHSCIQMITGEQSLIIDPFFKGNKLAVTKAEDIKTNAVLLTHAHMDHILDADLIAKQNDAPIVANPELSAYMSWKNVKTIGMNIGGTLDLSFATAKMVQAFHSSGIVEDDNKTILYGGMPAGYIVNMEGFNVLHAGDTGLFSDMKMIGERHPIEIAFIPIGDHYTMGIEDALQAAEWYNAKVVVPVHYNTFPVIVQEADSFVQQLQRRGINGKVLHPGECLTV